MENQRLSWKVLDAFQDACEEIGIPRIDDFNRGDNFGSSRFQVNQRRGIRWSSAKAFLKPVTNRDNLRVVTGAQAERILIENRQATGVLFEHEGYRPGRVPMAKSS